ncbi:MAG: hypothetical protein JXR73_21115 [Candidatus Omnitrophica bacterium]|nr:hypothetical protein [Candidatus Omnitrophota bacterium]
MKKKYEDLIGAFIALLSTLVIGSVVATSIYFDGLCKKSLFLMAAWLAAVSIMWSIPFFQWSIPHLLKKKSRNFKIVVDERSLVIFKNSVFAAHIVSWFYFLAAWIVAWRMAASDNSVSSNLISLMFVGWVVLFQFAHVISSLIQERSDWKNDR